MKNIREMNDGKYQKGKLKSPKDTLLDNNDEYKLWMLNDYHLSVVRVDCVLL